MTWPPQPKPAAAPRRPRKTPELDLQIQVAEFLRAAVVRPARWWHVPNGVNLSKAQRGRMKAAGLTPGVADLHFAWCTQELPAAFSMAPGSINRIGRERFGTIELKAGRGVLSPEQQDFRDDMRALGHYWAECRSLEEVVSTLEDWTFPLRASL